MNPPKPTLNLYPAPFISTISIKCHVVAAYTTLERHRSPSHIVALVALSYSGSKKHHLSTERAVESVNLPPKAWKNMQVTSIVYRLVVNRLYID